MILAVRTDKPEAELYLVDQDGSMVDQATWLASNQLSVQLLGAIKDLLERNDRDFSRLTGVVAFAGPGSFTGLRIGLTVANTIAYSLSVPIVGTTGDTWLQDGLGRLQTNVRPGGFVLPEYGADPHITRPKK